MPVYLFTIRNVLTKQYVSVSHSVQSCYTIRVWETKLQITAFLGEEKNKLSYYSLECKLRQIFWKMMFYYVQSLNKHDEFFIVSPITS